MDLESFFPAKDRFALAMSLNNLLAAPGFGAWMEGEPLDVDRMLHTPEGRPRVSIFSIAHLGADRASRDGRGQADQGERHRAARRAGLGAAVA
jgi:hypothetical protein